MHKNERGIVLIEFVICIAVIFLIFIATINLGLAFKERQTLIIAAREGARAGAVTKDDDEAIANAIEIAYQNIQMDGGGNANVQAEMVGETVEVVITENYNYLLPWPVALPFVGSIGLNNSVTLIGEATFLRAALFKEDFIPD